MVKKFEAHYHGTPIAVGKHFNIADVHASALMESGEWKELSIRDFYIPDTSVIQHSGENVYEAYYIYNGIKYTNYFTVFGYTNKETINPDFKLLLKRDNLYEDVTEKYYYVFFNMILEKIWVTQYKFELLPEGKYIITLPKNTGMHCKYATEWIIIRDNNTRLILNKVYHEEDEDNGEKEEFPDTEQSGDNSAGSNTGNSSN